MKRPWLHQLNAKKCIQWQCQGIVYLEENLQFAFQLTLILLVDEIGFFSRFDFSQQQQQNLDQFQKFVILKFG